MAPEMATALDEMQVAGVLRVERGTVAVVRAVADDVQVDAVDRSGSGRALVADAVVNCAGPPSARGNGDPLVATLLTEGLVTTEALGIGLAVDDQGRPQPDRYDGRVVVLGALRRGGELKATAIPDLRRQATSAARWAGSHVGERRSFPLASVSRRFRTSLVP
jgi:uncharacterized NAD(P)/FAD-binding protein YdhS